MNGNLHRNISGLEHGLVYLKIACERYVIDERCD